MKVAIYIRTSTEEQNPENQLKDCLSINKYGEYELIEDKESAWNDKKERIGFNKIKSYIKNRRIEHIIVWDLDRLYRNRKNLVDLFKLCEINKVKIHSFRQKWLEDINQMPSPWNDIVSDLMIQIMGWIAQDESDKKSQRVKSAIRIKADGAYSYKGNKWGRKQLSTYKKNLLKEIIKRNPIPTIRTISKEIGASRGVVHKYLTIIRKENLENMGCPQLVN